MTLTYTTRNNILDAIETLLLTVDGINEVDREHKGVDDMIEPRGVHLSDTSEERRTIVSDCILCTYQVKLVPYIFDDKSTIDDLNTALNALIVDIKTVIQSNPTLTGTVKRMTILDIDTSDGFEAPYAHGTITMEVVYLSEV